MLGLGSRNSIMFTAALIALAPLTSKADAELLWKNSKGFVTAETCQIVQQIDSELRRVKTSGAIVNAKTSKLPSESLTTINEDVFEIKGTSLPLKIGKTEVLTKGSFWQVSLSEEGQYLTYQCEEKGHLISYTVFDVFTSQSTAPLARVGVQADETTIFQLTEVYKPEDADKKLDALAAQSFGSAGTSSQAPLSLAKPVPRPQFLNVAPTPTEPSTHEVTCFGSAGGQVFDETLTKVLFTAAPKEKMIAVQSWNKNRLEKKVNGKSVGFIRVLFPDRDPSANTGYIDESSMKSRTTCEVSNEDDEGKDLRSRRHKSRGKVRGSRNAKRYKRAMTLGGAPLSEKVSTGSGVFEFPTYDRPQSSYLEGARRFHAGRRGRLHAACDLYRPHGEGVVAIADGVVISNRYRFYQDVFAIEIRLDNGSIVRYGEILGRLPPGIRLGARVKKGQTVGYIGTVSSGCCHPMLHFELYSGKAKGPLTIRGRGKKVRRGHKRASAGTGYQRRADLMNPTTLLRTWEKTDFGRSY